MDNIKSEILVTAATGNVGSEIIKLLLEKGIPFKAADIKDARQVFGEKVEYEYFDFENPDTYNEAFRGVKKMFLNRPPQMTEFNNSIFPAILAAKEAGVEHVVFLSMIGVNKRVPHYKIEKFLIKSGLKYTFLRASFFMQNLNTVHGDIIKKENDLLIPAGKGKISFIDIRDIAAVAVKVFLDDTERFINQTLNLSGCEALGFYQISQIMTDVLGKKITYSNPKSKHFIAKMKEYGFTKDFIKVMKMIYFIVRLGKADMIYPDTEEILGRTPITMKQYIEDYAQYWI